MELSSHKEKDELWETIFSLCHTFFSLEPWKEFSETDIFGIQSPGRESKYYASIMGELGEVYALASYQGDVALEQFWFLHEGGSHLPVGTIMSIPHLMVSLDELEDIGHEQSKYIKKLGLKPFVNNSYPHVKQIIPGLLPAPPAKEILPDLVHILEQSIWVVLNARKNGKAFIHTEGDSEDDYYTRIPVSTRDGLVWKGEKLRVSHDFGPVSATYNSAVLERFTNLPPSRDILQMELCPIPFPVREAGRPDYFPVAFMMVNARTGMIEMYETMTPFPSYMEMVAQLPSIIMQKSLQLGWRPVRVKYRSFHLGPIATFLQKQSKAKIWHSFRLPALDEALDGLISSLDKNS